MKSHMALNKMLQLNGKVIREKNAYVVHHGIYTMRAVLNDGRVIACFLISDKDASANVPDYSGMYFKTFGQALKMLVQRKSEYERGELVTKPS